MFKLNRTFIQLAMLLTSAAATVAQAQPTYKFSMGVDKVGTRIPMPVGFLDVTQTTELPIFGTYMSAAELLPLSFDLMVGFVNPLSSNAASKAFTMSDLSSLSATIGTEVWGMDGSLTANKGYYSTNNLGTLTGFWANFHSVNGNSLSLNFFAGANLWIATNHHYAGYDEVYSMQACGIGSDGFWDGACFGGKDITSELIVPGEVEIPQSVVPEPSSWALMALGLGSLAVAARRRRAANAW